MKKVANLDVELTIEERNLLSVGYKNVIGARRASWRILSSIEQKEESRGNDVNAKRIKEYRQKVESELSTICGDIMTVIDEHLIPSCSGGESTVFYYKMCVTFSSLQSVYVYARKYGLFTCYSESTNQPRRHDITKKSTNYKKN